MMIQTSPHTRISSDHCSESFRMNDSLQWSDRKSTRLNSSHDQISYAVFCLKKKKKRKKEHLKATNIERLINSRRITAKERLTEPRDRSIRVTCAALLQAFCLGTRDRQQAEPVPCGSHA